MKLEDSVQFVKGVGEQRAKSLNKLGIYTVEDLITYYPRDYEDRSKIKNIADTFDGDRCTIEAYALTSVTNRMIR